MSAGAIVHGIIHHQHPKIAWKTIGEVILLLAIAAGAVGLGYVDESPAPVSDFQSTQIR